MDTLNGLLPDIPSRVGSGAPGPGLAGLLQGADAEAELVRGILEHQLILTSKSTAAAAFLYAYGLGDLGEYIMRLRRYHQRPRGLVKALDAAALKDFFQGMQIQIGSK